jgi:phosphate transport system protein
MERHLDQELVEYREMLLAMGSYAEQALAQSVQAVLERNDESAKTVIADDAILDRIEMEIDARSVSLLALQGPVAADLRQIIAAMRIAQNLERIGDEATKIARRGLELNSLPRLEADVDLTALAGPVTGMLHAAMQSWNDNDFTRAQPIIARDKQVDAIYRACQNQLTKYMIANAGHVVRCLHWMTVCKCLERIGDHAANIAEATVYRVEARDIRHRTLSQQTLPANHDPHLPDL